MSPLQAITTCLRKSFQFSGRASFSEFWWFAVLYVGGAFASFWLVDIYLPNRIASIRNPAGTSLLVFLAIFACPFIAAAWRRNQDRGRAGVWVLPPFLVLAFGIALGFLLEWLSGGADLAGLPGAVVGYGGFLLLSPFVLISLAAPSTPTPNRYGPNPLEVTP